MKLRVLMVVVVGLVLGFVAYNVSAEIIPPPDFCCAPGQSGCNAPGQTCLFSDGTACAVCCPVGKTALCTGATCVLGFGFNATCVCN
jgi:hypothetical protein